MSNWWRQWIGRVALALAEWWLRARRAGGEGRGASQPARPGAPEPPGTAPPPGEGDPGRAG